VYQKVIRIVNVFKGYPQATQVWVVRPRTGDDSGEGAGDSCKGPDIRIEVGRSTTF
jgi:hypothetical protein